MENKNEIFCSNHSNKGAKKHCGQCNLDLCNECALDQHIDHYKSLEKIENCIKNKYLIYKEALDQEIKKILNNTADEISLKVYNNVQEKALKNFNEYKNNDNNKPKFVDILRTQFGLEKGKEKEKEKEKSSIKINNAASELKGDSINKNEEKKSPVEEKQPLENKEKETKKTEIKVEEEKKLEEKKEEKKEEEKEENKEEKKEEKKEENKEENKDKVESEKNNEEENKNKTNFTKEDLVSDKSQNSDNSDKSEKSQKSDNESNSASEDEDKKEEKDADFRGSMITKKNVKNNLLGNMLAKPPDDKEQKKTVHFKEDEQEIKRVEKKLEMVENLMDTGEEDQLKKQINLSKRKSVGVVEFSSFRKRQFQSGKIEVSSLYEIKEEYVDDKKENEESDSTKIPNINITDKDKEKRRMKTDEVLPSIGGGLNAAEDRKNRLARRLNKAKQVAKNKENANKYRKSVDITMKASLLSLQLNMQKEENK